MANLKRFFAPQSIALIGASRHDGSLGKMYLDAVIDMKYTGEILLVNPKAKEINGIPCYPDITSLPKVPDVAVILLSKNYVIPTVSMLAEKGVQNIIVISAGFKEVGLEGEQLEKTLVDLVRSHKIRMIGPNSMGLFNTDPSISLNATFSPTPPQPGHVGFISQSGALGVGILELSKRMGLGFSVFVSTGNKADMGDVDVLQYLKDDANTRVIMLYQEIIDHPLKFRELCNKTVTIKPILTLKAGRTASGLRAATSHTGALASDDRINDAFLAQCGIIRCKNLQELLDSVLVFASQPLPKGNKVAVITNAGGPGILASDALEQAGLELVIPEKETLAALEKILPPEAATHNPIDMIASATHETYEQVCSLLEQDKNVNALLLIIVKPPVNTTPQEIITRLTPLIRKSQKPFLCTLMADIDESSGLTQFHKLGVPVYRYPESAAVALGNMIKYKEIKQNINTDDFKADKLISLPVKELRYETKQAPFDELARRLKKYDLPMSSYIITQDIEEAVSFYERTGAVALKIANEQIIHKSDLGLVKLNMLTASEVRNAFVDIIKKASEHLPSGIKPKVLVQEMINSGTELILGAKKDPHFGHVIMFGIGGVFVELYKDVVFRVLPIGLKEAKRMIGEIKASQLYKGFRNYPALNLDILTEMIIRFSLMIMENTDIMEIDLNPMIWSPNAKRPIIVDGRMKIVY